VAVTIKAGENHVDGYGPGEGDLFVVDDETEIDDLPMADHVDETYSFDDAFGDLTFDDGNLTSDTSSQTADDGNSSPDDGNLTPDDGTGEEAWQSDTPDHDVSEGNIVHEAKDTLADGDGVNRSDGSTPEQDDNDSVDENSDDAIFGSAENDLFLFGSLENNGTIDGIDGPNWTDSIETGDVGAIPQSAEEIGWTQSVGDEHTEVHSDRIAEHIDDSDHIRTEESIVGTDDSDTIEW